jgi:hypothetical protein
MTVMVIFLRSPSASLTAFSRSYRSQGTASGDAVNTASTSDWFARPLSILACWLE